MFFSSPWRVKWRKCVCPSLSLRMRTQPYHPSIQAARKNGTTAKKRKRGKRTGKDGFFLTPLPALLFVPFFTWSLTLAPRSLLRNRTETLATLFTSCYGQLIALIWANFICFVWTSQVVVVPLTVPYIVCLFLNYFYHDSLLLFLSLSVCRAEKTLFN